MKRVGATPAQLALLGTAGWLAWRPAETFPWSPVLVAAVVLALTVWGWQRTPTYAGRAVWGVAGAVGLVLASGLAGRDPSAAITGAALMAGSVILVWLASREVPPKHWPSLLALVISGLAIWGLLQLNAGPERTEAILTGLPEALRSAAAERLAAQRAFASQPLPSHLAILLATALPLLVTRLRWRWSAAPWAVGTALCVVGLAATRSPIGVGLALTASAVLALRAGGRAMKLSVAVLVIILVAVVLVRGDVLELEPVSLRLDNWQTAAWVWSTAPAAGVGFGGFGQAAQVVPFSVGNRPRHAHSLPLEWLAELGPVGFVVVILAGVALWRLIRDLWPRRPDLAVAIAVVPAHNLVDFSLYGSGVALPWAVLLGWAVAMRGPTQAVGAGPRGRRLATTLAAAGLAVTALHATSVVVEESARMQDRPDERYESAISASRLAPWRANALHLIAISALETGDRVVVAEAATELERYRWLRPNSAALADLRGRLEQAMGHGPSAAAEAWTAHHAHPTNPAYRNGMVQVFRRLQGDGRD